MAKEIWNTIKVKFKCGHERLVERRGKITQTILKQEQAYAVDRLCSSCQAKESTKAS